MQTTATSPLTNSTIFMESLLMFRTLYSYRFEILFFSQITILFGSLLVPLEWFEHYVSPLLFILNLMAGILLFSNNKWKTGIVCLLLLFAGLSFGVDISETNNKDAFNFVHLGTFFLFYIFLTIELVRQVWSAKHVGKNVILGLISGYISLGLIGFFICMTIEMAAPGSFVGLEGASNGDAKADEMIYYSYITLMTIGYGEIAPVTSIARKAAVLIGLLGQIYLVVLTAIIVGKYIQGSALNKD